MSIEPKVLVIKFISTALISIWNFLTACEAASSSAHERLTQTQRRLFHQNPFCLSSFQFQVVAPVLSWLHRPEAGAFSHLPSPVFLKALSFLLCVSLSTVTLHFNRVASAFVWTRPTWPPCPGPPSPPHPPASDPAEACDGFFVVKKKGEK